MDSTVSRTNVPSWDLGDRMRKSLKVAGISVNDMAARLEVTRETVSTWINGRHRPTAAVLLVWADATHVPYSWLRDGLTDARELQAAS